MDKKRRNRSNAAFYAALMVCLTAAGVGTWRLLRSTDRTQSGVPPQVDVVSGVLEESPAVEAALPGPIDEPVYADPDPVQEPVPEPSVSSGRASESVSASAPAPVPAAPDPEPVPHSDGAPAVEKEREHLPIVLPLEGETVAAFSVDRLLYNASLADWRTHEGIDIAAEEGTQVLCACAGTVASVEEDPLMGLTVVVSHDGGYETTYASLLEVPVLEAGDPVPAGDLVGTVGNTAPAEASQGPHLHFSVTKDGEPVDPADFLLPDGVTVGEAVLPD